MKTVYVTVKIDVSEDYDAVNDGVGALADMIREGLNSQHFNYIDDMVIVKDAK